MHRQAVNIAAAACGLEQLLLAFESVWLAAQAMHGVSQG